MAAAPLTLADRIGDRVVVVDAHIVNGNGDLMLAAKIAEALGLVGEQIILRGDHGERAKTLGLDKKFTVMAKYPAVERVVALHISAPCPGVPLPIDKKIPAIRWDEYGFGKPYDCDQSERRSFGLGEEDDGIFIDENLYQWSQDQRSHDAEQRTLQLGNLSFPVLSKLLDEKVESEAGLRERLIAFQKTNVVYFAYVSKKEIRSAFVNAIRAKDTSDKKITFFFAGTELIGETFPSEVRVLGGKLTHEEMRAFFRGAERLTMVTGDQSLSEAISAGIPFIYERYEHKTVIGAYINALYGYITVPENIPSMVPSALERVDEATVAEVQQTIYRTHNAAAKVHQAALRILEGSEP